MENQREYNIAFVGRPNTGKTALTLQIVEKQFYESINHTDGIFKVKKELDNLGFSFLVNIHDLEGFDFPNEKLSTMIINCDAICVVFDATKYINNDELKIWIDYIHEALVNKPNVALFLVGTHLDEINVSEGSVIMDQVDLFKLPFFFVNNKDYYSVQNLFYSIIENLCQEYKLASQQSLHVLKNNFKSIPYLLDSDTKKNKKENKKITPQKLEQIQEKEIKKQKNEESFFKHTMKYIFPCCYNKKKLS